MKRITALSSAILFMLLATFSAGAAPKVITWEDLAPTDTTAPTIDFSKFIPKKGMPKLSEFNGSQAALDEYVENLEFMRDIMQPKDGDALAMSLNGIEVKIAGYVTPLSFEGENVVDFLFVPYLGACSHVPSPGANQIVYVEGATGMRAEALYDPVWLIGRLLATPVTTPVANVGYTISGAKIESYQE